MTRRRSQSCANTEPSELRRRPAWAIRHYPSRGGWLLDVLAPFIKDGEVDLADLLASGSEKLGIIAERNYGEYLDGLFKQAPADALPPHYGNYALGRLAGTREP